MRSLVARVRGLAGIALLVGTFAGCSGHASVSLPPDSASPRAVLDVYLKALVTGDCVSAYALATDSFGPTNGNLCGSLSVTAYHVNATPATPNSGEVVFATTVTTKGGDETLRDGDHTWFYTLQRQPNGSWRLTGGGTGP